MKPIRAFSAAGLATIAALASVTVNPLAAQAQDPEPSTAPTITATVSSQPAGSGWYRSPVTVAFTCTEHGSPLVDRCPDPLLLTADRRQDETVELTVTAEDGQTGSVLLTGIGIDRTPPLVRARGVRNQHTYRRMPSLGCVARDRTSKVASCMIQTNRIERPDGADKVRYRLVARDHAGNRGVSRGAFFVRR